MKTKIKREELQPKLVMFGGGRTVISTDGYRIEGYETPENFFSPEKWWTDDFMTKKDHSQYEGVPFVDIREAVKTEKGIHMVCLGPMLDTKIHDGEVNKCPEPSPVMAFGLMESPEFRGLLSLQSCARLNNKRYGPLDSVSVNEVTTLLREERDQNDSELKIISYDSNSKENQF